MAKAGDVFGYAKEDPLYDMEVQGIKSPLPNIPVTDAMNKAEVEAPQESYLTKKTDSSTEEVVEQKEAVEVEAPKGIQLTEESLVIDPRDGKEKPFKEIMAMAPLKKEYDADKYQLAREKEQIEREKQIVDGNKPFLEAAYKSPFARTLLNSLTGDIPEDQAIAAAFAASGKSNPFAQQQATDPDPEPQIPSDFDLNIPEHAAIAAKRMSWENRQAARQMAQEMVAPLQKELQDLRREKETERQQSQARQAEAQRIADHNKQMLGAVQGYLKFDLGSLPPDQAKQFWLGFDDAAASLGVTPDHPLSKAEIAGIVGMTAPGGLNPFVQAAPKTPEKIVIEQPKKMPLAPGTSGGSRYTGEAPLSEKDRMRNILEGMSTGAM